jgi:hypothetical protein
MLERLKRRTEYFECLTTKNTDKSFRGVIEYNHFKLITPKIGFGAFCAMEGNINATTGTFKVTIHKVFKGFLSLFMLFLIAEFIMLTFFDEQEFSWVMPLVLLMQIAIIRFAIIELVFRRLSK